MIIVGENGETIDFTIEYKPTQEEWYFSLIYGTTIINGRKVCNFPNMLRQWKNIIPFGLACVISDGGEPNFLEDFTTGRATLLLLNAQDVLDVETYVLEA